MKTKKVMVIDDDVDILESLHFLLEEEGYNVISSPRGECALELVKRNETLPQVIILDMYLSGYDGRTIAQTLKTNKKTKHIPIIMISAKHNAEKNLNQKMIDMFLAKPFNISEFLNSVERYTHD